MKLWLLYGSQTGNAQEVAFDLAFEARRRLIEVKVFALDEVLDDILDIRVAVFVVATTGYGEVPDNMKRFWRGIMAKSLKNDFLKNLSFTVFGLGDSTYQNFNVVARKLWVRAKALGATPIIEKGLGDDIHDFSYEAEFQPWCENLFKGLVQYFPLLPQIDVIQGLLPAIYEVQVLQTQTQTPSPSPNPHPHSTTVTSTKLLSHQYGKTLQIDLEPLAFNPGDTFAVYPQNPQSKVQDLMKRLSWEDQVLSIIPTCSNQISFTNPFPSPILLSELLTHHIDLHRPASRHLISILGHLAQGLHKEKLLEMASKDLTGRNEFHRYVTKEYRNVCEVLYDFSSIETLPLEYFLECVRIIRPREFSIAGSQDLRLLVSQVSFSTLLNRNIKGFCTDYLAQVKVADRVKGLVVQGRFEVPSLNQPVVFVATGTGIAPIWSILESRIRQGATENLLFYGVRHPDHDFYFKDQIENYQSSGLCSAFIAFSQHGRKTYVQDLISQNSSIVNSYLFNNCSILICGKAKMLGKSIKASLISCLNQSLSPIQSENFFKSLEQSKRFQIENW